MHFPGLSRLSESRKQCPWNASIFTCYLGPWGSQKQPSTWGKPGLLILWNHDMLWQPRVPLQGLGWTGTTLEEALKGYQALRGKGGERKARGNRSSLTIITSSHRVEEDFPDPLTLRLGSERKRKHICTAPLSELPQGGARPFGPFATGRAMHTHIHS